MDSIKCRCRILAMYIIETEATIRETARAFGYSKSTVHSDVSYKLQYYDYSLYLRVKDILDYHFAQKHIRGGISTKNKYLKKKNGD